MGSRRQHYSQFWQGRRRVISPLATPTGIASNVLQEEEPMGGMEGYLDAPGISCTIASAATYWHAVWLVNEVSTGKIEEVSACRGRHQRVTVPHRIPHRPSSSVGNRWAAFDLV